MCHLSLQPHIARWRGLIASMKKLKRSQRNAKRTGGGRYFTVPTGLGVQEIGLNTILFAPALNDLHPLS
jgi:hypothetical protein